MDKETGKGIPFNRIRRVTGYLAGDVRMFNDAKRAEEKDRVKHFISDKQDKNNGG